MTATTKLADAGGACLVVIDVQQYFLDKLPEPERAPLVARIAWLMAVARVLEIPVLTTAEDTARMGGLVPELARELADDARPTFDKSVFGLAGQQDIRTAVESLGRQQVVLAGLETDVCVAQSALGLRSHGFDVYAIDNCCGSPGDGHQAGLVRMRRADVAVMALKGLYYEWVRTVPAHRRIQDELARDLPAGLEL